MKRMRTYLQRIKYHLKRNIKGGSYQKDKLTPKLPESQKFYINQQEGRNITFLITNKFRN